MKKLFVLFLFLSSSSYADGEGYFKFGSGIDDVSVATTKIIAAGFQAPLISVFDYQLESGVFLDNRQPQGVIYFGGASLGLSVYTSSGIYAKLFSGPSLISQTDTRLSSPFEFNDDLEVGLKDERNVGLGVNFKHISNAGIVLPNLGRDFVLVKFQIPF